MEKLNKNVSWIRVDMDFKKIIDDVKIERIKNNLEKQQISSREITRMVTNAPSFRKVLFELKTLPRRKNEIK